MLSDNQLVALAKDVVRPIIKAIPKGWSKIRIMYCQYGTEDALLVQTTAPDGYDLPDLHELGDSICRDLRQLQSGESWKQLVIFYDISGKLEIGTNNIIANTLEEVLSQMQ